MDRRASPEPVTAVLDTAGSWLPGALGQVEESLSAAAGSTGALSEDATATLMAGGKRMRPMLVLLAAGPDGLEGAVRAAVAVELIHTASLVHDDVLDRAPLRRGEPTVFARSGRESATAVGDALFARAFGLLAEAGDIGAVTVLSETARDLVAGELLQRRAAFDLGLTEDEYFERCRLKTGSLFSSACVLGALAGDREEPDDAVRQALAEFGSAIGLAFQMLDDVLDLSGPEERTGKARGTDLLDGTVTLPVITAIGREPGLATEDLRTLDPSAATAMADRIAATGALEEVRRRAAELVAVAKADLEGVGVPEDRRELLTLVADGVVLRYS